MKTMRTVRKSPGRLLAELLPEGTVLRIRRCGNSARIETRENSFIDILTNRDAIVPVLLEAGFRHVALDLEGTEKFQTKDPEK